MYVGKQQTTTYPQPPAILVAWSHVDRVGEERIRACESGVGGVLAERATFVSPCCVVS